MLVGKLYEFKIYRISIAIVDGSPSSFHIFITFSHKCNGILFLAAFEFSPKIRDYGIVIKMSWKWNMSKIYSSHFHHNFIKMLWKLDFANSPLLDRLSILHYCNIVIKMWWNCDASKFVLIFWLTSFENCRHPKNLMIIKDDMVCSGPFNESFVPAWRARQLVQGQLSMKRLRGALPFVSCLWKPCQ